MMLCKTQIVDVTSLRDAARCQVCSSKIKVSWQDVGGGRECCFYDFPYISRLLGLLCSTRLTVVVSQ